VPAIKEKWPDRNRNVIIQQDGACSHILENDIEFCRLATQGVGNICLLTQPAKSTDLNVLDLSFFRALQSSQWSSGYQRTIEGLIRHVESAYANFEPRKIDKGFLTLQTCMEEILNIYGANDYEVPHMGKDAMLQAAVPPTRVEAGQITTKRMRTTTNNGHIAARNANDSSATLEPHYNIITSMIHYISLVTLFYISLVKCCVICAGPWSTYPRTRKLSKKHKKRKSEFNLQRDKLAMQVVFPQGS
jgi:hypothetical protein